MAGPGAKPSLVIPMTFDAKEALAILKKLGLEARDAGAEIKGAEEKSRGLGEAVKDVLTHQGYQMLKDGAAALSAGYKETADYIKEVSSEYVKLREVLQEVAALKDKDNSGSFTADQARDAARAGLKPEEWVNFQSAFESYAGAYLEGDQQRLSEDDAVTYQQRLATFAKARGISADQAAQLGGGILQFAEGPLSADEATARFGRAFKTLERSSTPVNELLPQMSKVMAQGASADEAAQLLDMAAEFAPNEEETYVRTMLDSLRENVLKGRGEELGVAKGMSPLEMVRAASERLSERVAGGEDLDALVAEYFNDKRESKAAKGFMNRGAVAGGFDRVAGYVAGTGDDFVQTTNEAYDQSDQGRHARAEAELAKNRIEIAEEYKEVEQRKLEAEAELTKEGRFMKFGIEDVVRGSLSYLPLAGFGTREQQLIEQRAVQNVYREAQGVGIQTEGWLSGSADDAVFMGSLTAGNEMKSLLERIATSGEKQAVKSLSAPPPNPGARPR